MMAKFTYDDVVRVIKSESSSAGGRIGQKAWVIAVFDDERKKPGLSFCSLPSGVIYSIEFEDGEAIDIHEDCLEPA